MSLEGEDWKFSSDILIIEEGSGHSEEGRMYDLKDCKLNESGKLVLAKSKQPVPEAEYSKYHVGDFFYDN
jgi:hypothetical protein